MQFTVPSPSVAIASSDKRFPVHRIYCIGRNYAEHVREMGNDPEREAPIFFLKPADTVAENGAAIPYPPRTSDLHHEIELVVAIGRGGKDIDVAAADRHIFGYAVGIDLTRRDLQTAAKKKGRPWDTGKSFEHAAPLSSIHAVEDIGHPGSGRIWLSVNDEPRQEGDIADMVWSVPEAIAELSTLFTLAPGDLIFTGTPAGVGAVARGDALRGGITGIDEIAIHIT